jgi:hypothetical protein
MCGILLCKIEITKTGTTPFLMSDFLKTGTTTDPSRRRLHNMIPPHIRHSRIPHIPDPTLPSKIEALAHRKAFKFIFIFKGEQTIVLHLAWSNNESVQLGGVSQQ